MQQPDVLKCGFSQRRKTAKKMLQVLGLITQVCVVMTVVLAVSDFLFTASGSGPQRSSSRYGPLWVQTSTTFPSTNQGRLLTIKSS
jgi:hypothetical protein